MNAVKHAHCTNVTVAMVWKKNELSLSVGDNGKGFDFPTEDNMNHGRHGLGLYSLENRAALLGASIKFVSNLPSGTLLKINLPLNG